MASTLLSAGRWPSSKRFAAGTNREGWPAGTDVTTLRYRVTDLRVAARRRPLSVSSDLIGVTAMRCVSILDRLGATVDRSGLSGPAIEIYPAAALNRWGLTSTGYKGRARSEVRKRLVADLCEGLAGTCEVDEAAAGLCEASDDALDSLVAVAGGPGPHARADRGAGWPGRGEGRAYRRLDPRSRL